MHFRCPNQDILPNRGYHKVLSFSGQVDHGDTAGGQRERERKKDEKERGSKVEIDAAIDANFLFRNCPAPDTTVLLLVETIGCATRLFLRKLQPSTSHARGVWRTSVIVSEESQDATSLW